VPSPPLIAIFGAAVLRDGRPSPSLLRRICYGHEAAGLHPEARILCSGGVGRAGPSEASIMAAALTERGLHRDRLILDEESLDTFDSAVVTARHARAHESPHVVVCSDRYHVLRIRLLLGALGVATQPGPAWPGTGGAPLGHWTRMTLREGLAIPYDLTLMAMRRRALTRAMS
jgi:vancomycin permeability regulator SanA